MVDRKPAANGQLTVAPAQAVAMITCDSCGEQMPAHEWSCPHCGDLNVDAEAHHFSFLNTGQADPYASSFTTPMDPGPFTTPMQPWNTMVDPSLVIATIAPEQPETTDAPQETVAAPHHSAADTIRAAHRAEMQSPRRPAAGSPSAYGQTPARRVPNMREWRGSPQARRSEFAFAWEMLGYIGLLGIGHMYAGAYKRGFALLILWMVWLFTLLYLVIMHATSLWLILLTCAMPFLSGLWARGEIRENME
jgi:hypothetical protein